MPFGQAPEFDKEGKQMREEGLQDFISISVSLKKKKSFPYILLPLEW